MAHNRARLGFIPPQSWLNLAQGELLTRDAIVELFGPDAMEGQEEDGDTFDLRENAVGGKKNPYTSVELIPIDNPLMKETILCSRGFPLVLNWLQARVSVKHNPRGFKVFEALEYRLAVVSGQEENISSIYTFMKSVSQDIENYGEQWAKFQGFLRALPPNAVSLVELPNLLDDFLNRARGTDDEKMLRDFQRVVFPLKWKTLASRVFMAATKAPKFFSLILLLFPSKCLSILDILQGCNAPCNLLHTLEEMVQRHPWKYAFQNVTFKATQVGGLEASFAHMKLCPFWAHLPQSMQEAIAIYDIIKSQSFNFNHTFLYLKDIRGHSHAQRIRDLDPGLNILKEFSVIFQDTSPEGRVRYHLARFWNAEIKIIRGMQMILTRSVDYSNDVNLQGHQFAKVQSDPDQMQAATMILTNPITVISGRGGTGKTEVVTSVLKAIEEFLQIKESTPADLNDSNQSIPIEEIDSDHEKSMIGFCDLATDSCGPVLYTAPTGKAASVIGTRAGAKAYTIHQIWASYNRWQKQKSDEEWKFAGTKFLVLDESSMISLELLSTLITILVKNSIIEKMVLVGDRHQLPSIGPGNIFHDFFLSMRSGGSSTELMMNHRSDGTAIFQNAQKISCGILPTLDSADKFELAIPYQNDVDCIPPEFSKGIIQMPEAQFGRRRYQNDPNIKEWHFPPEKHQIYSDLIRGNRKAYDLEDPTRSQIIAFQRKECEALNELSVFAYNHHLIKEPKKDQKKVLSFQVRDKIIVTKNSTIEIFRNVHDDERDVEQIAYFTQELSSETTQTESFKNSIKYRISTRLMNGTLFMIKNIFYMSRQELKDIPQKAPTSDEARSEPSDDSPNLSQNSRHLLEIFVLDDMNGNKIGVEAEQFQRQCLPRHAYAITIHKFQGSETDTIVYGVSKSKFETRAHVYTACTRARKRVIIVGNWCDLAEAIERELPQRQTALDERILKLLAIQSNGKCLDLEFDSNEPQTASNTCQKRILSPSPSDHLFDTDDDMEEVMKSIDTDLLNSPKKSKRT